VRVTLALEFFAGLALVLAQSGGAESRYMDPAGDSSPATDLTSVLVSNDAAGQISFRVDHPNPQVFTSDVRIGLLLDSDRNPRTGAISHRGADYLLETHPKSLPALLRWTGSSFAGVPTYTLGLTGGTGYLLLSINRSELEGTRGFSFWVRTSEGSDLFGAQRADDAPNTGTWSYQLAITRPVSLTELVERVRTGVIRIEADSCEGKEIGSGVLIGARHIATVEHVVGDARTIVLKRNGRSLGRAKVIGRDRARDLALLQTTRAIAGYRFALDAGAPQVGDPVAVLGYPAGLPLSVTRGSVSGLKRSVSINGVRRRGLVQTDAAVNHGNSGGPLLSIETGALLGLVDIGSTQLNGIAFAVSTQVAKPLLTAWKASPQARPTGACG